MRAVVCGAGIAGLTLAWWLERDGWDVLLVEQADGPRDEGYMIDFFGSGYDVADRMGLLPRLREIQTTNRVLRYVDPAGHGRGAVRYDLMADAVAGRLFTFMRGDLERVLREALDGRVPVRYATTVEAVRQATAGLRVTLSDGSTHDADLLAGTDGIHSRVRELAFGPEGRYLRYLGYHTASYLLTDDELRQRVGERFLLVAAPDRQAGLYPTNDGRLAAWFTHRAEAAPLPEARCAGLRTAHRGMGDLVDRALERCPRGAGLYYDQVAQIELPAWTSGRVALVGDAAYAVSLLAGQGASMAMGGAYVLAGELRRGRSVQEALARYEDRLRPLVAAKQRSGRRTARWLVPSHRWQITARALALRMSQLPGAGRLVRAAFAVPLASVVDRHAETLPADGSRADRGTGAPRPGHGRTGPVNRPFR